MRFKRSFKSFLQIDSRKKKEEDRSKSHCEKEYWDRGNRIEITSAFWQGKG